MIEFFKTLSKFFEIDKSGMTYTIRDPEEKLMWNSIVKKAERGYQEFWKECEKDRNYMGWPWMSPGLTKEESEFIENLHNKFFGIDYIVDPVVCSQADYMWYEDVKNRIIVK